MRRTPSPEEIAVHHAAGERLALAGGAKKAIATEEEQAALQEVAERYASRFQRRGDPLSEYLVEYGKVMKIVRFHGKTKCFQQTAREKEQKERPEKVPERQWSCADLAAAARVTAKHLARIETGKAEPRLLVAVRIARLLGMTIDELDGIVRDRLAGRS